jgi:ankyrin repeat protein
MVGNHQIRFCTHCQSSVHDFSQMSRKQIRRLVAKSKGRLCVKYSSVTPRPAITPTKALYKIGRRTSMIVAGAFSASLSLSSAVGATHPRQTNVPGQIATATTHHLFEPTLHGGTGSLHGVIFDPNGAAIPGAIVTLINSETRQISSVVSDGEGTYEFTGIEVGIYSLKIQARGFATSQVSMITLNANDNNRVDQTLSIASINEVVEVTAPEQVIMGGAMVATPEEPLVRAALSDNIEAVKENLLKFDANIRDRVTDWTSLECAVRNGNREMVQVLLASKADVNARDRSGQTVLMMIGEEVTSDLVWDLLNAGAKINLRDHDGDTALLEAATVNNTEALRTLLDAGAKVNLANNNGETPLMKAASEGLVNSVRILLQAGAEINQRDKRGKTALTYAKENDHRAVMRLLTSFGALEFEPKEEP